MMPIPLDPLFLLVFGFAIILAIWAQVKVKSAFAAASQVRNSRGMSGADAARHILDAAGLHDVQIELSRGGGLSDHYDPRAKVLRLSQEVYAQPTLAAVGIAAHEAGHAIQDAKNYKPLVMRNGLVPLAATGSWLSTLLIVGGVLLGMFSAAGLENPLVWNLVAAGVVAFGATVVFQLINLPVEFDASRRAKVLLVEHGIVAQSEMAPVNKVLSAAAMTYVAATLIALTYMIYYILLLLAHRN